MENLIKALQIFNQHYPELFLTARHDVIILGPCKKKDISKEHRDQLEDLDFTYSEEDEGYIYFT